MLLTKYDRDISRLPQFGPFALSSLLDEGWPTDLFNRKEQWIPPMDVSETNTQYKVRLESPGMKKDDIKVELENDVLTISGEKHTGQETDDEKVYRSERCYGSFARRLRLNDIDNDKVYATYEDGVLEVTIAKAEAVRPRNIAIK